MNLVSVDLHEHKGTISTKDHCNEKNIYSADRDPNIIWEKVKDTAKDIILEEEHCYACSNETRYLFLFKLFCSGATIQITDVLYAI